MHVGLNLVYLAADSGGTGTYARGLIPALLEADPRVRLTLFTSASAPPQLREAAWAADVDWVDVPIPGSGGPPWTFVPRTAAQWGALPLIAARRRIDVVHGLCFIAPVVRGATATVVSAHDLIWLHDPAAVSRLARTAMRFVAPPSIRAADRVITGSAYAARDIERTLGISAERITVVTHGPGEVGQGAATPAGVLRRRLGLGDAPFVLAVGQRGGHKNLGRLVEAFGVLEDAAPRLVLAGPPSPQDARLREVAHAAGVGERVLILDWVSPADLEGLYGAATCLALPSLQEGFGFTAVEAMARGVPVACSAAMSLTDTVAGAALLFDATSPASIAEALRRLLRDPDLRADLAARGHERARALDWRASAEGTLAVYEAAVQSRRLRRRARPAARAVSERDRRRAAQEFYERAYSHTADEGRRFGAWRAITGAGKAERALRALRDLPPDGVSVLDVGCGDGALLAELCARRPQWTLVGVEVAAAAARIARERLPGVDVRVYDGSRLPWPDASFDVALLSHVLEHVADPPATLREVARVARLVVVEVPLEANLSARRASKRAHAQEIGHLQRLSRADVRRLVRDAGLELREELTGTLTRDALAFFAAGRGARLRADAKWAIQRALHRCAPRLAERIFTVQYVALCAASPR